MPVWLRNFWAVCIILVFSTGFYWFFIRPYAYRWKPCYGQKGYGVCMPCNYEVHGIDISHYQGKIDWELLTHNREAKFPIHFIFLKATEGGDHGDDTFTQNFGQARKYGFIRGAYHYFIPKTDAHKKRYLSDSIFNAYPYWIAHYYVDSVRYEGKWHFWQHTDVGTVPGIEKEVDLNVFNGTLEELQALTLQK